ncbi:OLC1v1012478C1 [Oldenlandia corymbosa var. corymbosa]|uniref:OLC1v1012478C1 n=1 Tax=Oldenlandia corymbosa var. corymbosa TaxID=529605 RepID=A0AAV1DZE8_OLDCO|nr:OLC1v1012478C1 [Oldenlandia corymbosa var. corymbosa]
MKRVIDTLKVLVKGMDAMSKDGPEALGKTIRDESRRIKESDATLSAEQTLYNFVPPGIVDKVEATHEMNQKQQQPTSDLDYQNALDEEIRQVIYKESLSEAVMNLALEEVQQNSNGRGGNVGSLYFYGVDAKSEIGMVEAMGVNGKVLEGSEGERSRSGNDSAVSGQYGHDGAEAEGKGEDEGNDKTGENGSFGGNGNFSKKQFQYPVRIDAEDCPFYMKTGNCKFGMNCKFNHPPKRRNQVGTRDRSKTRTEDLDRGPHTECKYYLTSGGCKFGNSCKYSHNKGRSSVSPILEFNFLGLPIRLGERECPYYMRTGSCKYGSNCKFNHPDPTPAAGNDLASGFGNIGSIKLQGASQPTDISWSSSSVILPQSPTVPLDSDWNGYQAPSYPASSDGSLPTPPAFAMNNMGMETKLFTSHHLQPIPVNEFPQRPGQPDCSYFLRTGDCKYKATCRFNHPKPQSSQPLPCVLSEKGLPLRPDQSICSFYNRYGICKFGPACKFNHPENWDNSSPDVVGLSRSEMEAGFP